MPPATTHNAGTVYALVCHPVDQRFLALAPIGESLGRSETEAARRLPSLAIERSEPYWEFDAGAMERAARERGLPLRLLRVIEEWESACLCEIALADDMLPGAAAWTSLEAVNEVAQASGLSDAALRAVELWRREVEGGRVPESRVPWARPGWRAEAESWIHEVLDSRGDAATRATETLRIASRSALLRVQARDAGTLYFKADAARPYEAAILDQLIPTEHSGLPDLLALDVERGWTLSRDFGPGRLDAFETELWQAAVAAHARLQMRSAEQVEHYLSLGCRDLRGGRLFAAFESLAQLASTASADEYRLNADEHAALSGHMRRIEADCDSLMSLGLPMTLVHQDFVACNIAIAGDQPIVFDWSDCAVGHPFFAVDRLLDDCWSDAERKAAVIEAYLAAWRDHASEAALQEAFRACMRLRVLYEGLRWQAELGWTEPNSLQARRLRNDMLAGLRMMLAHWAKSS